MKSGMRPLMNSCCGRLERSSIASINPAQKTSTTRHTLPDVSKTKNKIFRHHCRQENESKKRKRRKTNTFRRARIAENGLDKHGTSDSRWKLKGVDNPEWRRENDRKPEEEETVAKNDEANRASSPSPFDFTVSCDSKNNMTYNTQEIHPFLYISSNNALDRKKIVFQPLTEEREPLTGKRRKQRIFRRHRY